MRLPVLCASLTAAFTAGLLVTRFVPAAEAQSGPPPMTAQIINVMTMADEDIGPATPANTRSRLLAAAAEGTVSVQSGNVIRHYHAEANEIQLILEGSGSFWLGDREVQVKPGDLIIIPKGTTHAGSRATTGRFRALAIKFPPQSPTDTIPVP